MKARYLWVIGAIIVVGILVILATLALTPTQTEPAFAAAVAFAEAVGKGDDAAAFALLTPELQAYVFANCPDASVSRCIDDYTPPEWGGLLSAVFRNAAPAGDGVWQVNIISTYQYDVGFSGVCITYRMVRGADDSWRVAEWAGYAHCGTDWRTANRAP